MSPYADMLCPICAGSSARNMCWGHCTQSEKQLPLLSSYGQTLHRLHAPITPTALVSLLAASPTPIWTQFSPLQNRAVADNPESLWPWQRPPVEGCQSHTSSYPSPVLTTFMAPHCFYSKTTSWVFPPRAWILTLSVVWAWPLCLC